MYSKKQRIISFLMAFLLIFTFAFINPLTVSKSQAFAFVPVLTVETSKIITGILISAGIVLDVAQDVSQDQYSTIATNISNFVWDALTFAEKIAVSTLSIIENVVNVPVELYNKIKSIGERVLAPNDFTNTLLSQGIVTKYYTLKSWNDTQPDMSFPVYEGSFTANNSANRTYDMREAEPFFVFDGSLVEEGKIFTIDAVTKNVFNYYNEDYPIATKSSVASSVFDFLTPTLSGYDINTTSSTYKALYMVARQYNTNLFTVSFLSGTSSNSYFDLVNIDVRTLGKAINETIFKMYMIYNISNNLSGTIVDFYDLDGNFLYQYRRSFPTGQGLNNNITSSTITETIPNTSIEIESNPAPVVTNPSMTDNVLTLPSELSGSIGATSTDVNVGSTDVPDTPNTETMENINTNVGELVTGGELGEQVNTNIGTVEGLHGELTEKADFTGLMDILAEYISFMNISSISWLTSAISSMSAIFIPFVSLGMILFFIDRVLNGGA